jgi:hypothetical protein
MLSCDRREHFVDHEFDVTLRVGLMLFRHGMRAQKCRNEFERCLRLEIADYAQDLQLIIQRQTVTGFRFDRCRSTLQKPARMFQRLLLQSAGAARVLAQSSDCLRAIFLLDPRARRSNSSLGSRKRMRMRIHEAEGPRLPASTPPRRSAAPFRSPQNPWPQSRHHAPTFRHSR